jgi:hypothetical protein
MDVKFAAALKPVKFETWAKEEVAQAVATNAKAMIFFIRTP